MFTIFRPIVHCASTARTALAGLGLSMLLAFPASAALIIDQNQPSGPNYMAAFSQTDLAQSFQQSNDNIAGAGILLQPGIGSSDNVTISLYDALPNAGGNLLASGTEIGFAGDWVDVFWPLVSITPGSTYFLVFTGNTTLSIAKDITDPYPFGHVYANAGFGAFLDFDYAFRTWYDDEGIVAPVAAPPAIAILALALVGLGVVRRRRVYC